MVKEKLDDVVRPKSKTLGPFYIIGKLIMYLVERALRKICRALWFRVGQLIVQVREDQEGQYRATIL
ncbi:MAG: hypothetical protein QG568_594 [Patescibacteria group bacterium]|nr:hypothetical protein [Patescibacteria group bacterium]